MGLTILPHSHIPVTNIPEYPPPPWACDKVCFDLFVLKKERKNKLLKHESLHVNVVGGIQWLYLKVQYPGGGGALPYIGYIGMCRCEG